jgi:hypothetical protein
MIEFKLGEFYQNKTAKYLIPILNSFTNTFKLSYKKVRTSLVGVAIGDLSYDYAKGIQSKNCLFMVYDLNGMYNAKDGKYIDAHKSRQNLANYLKYLRSQEYYVDDYVHKIGEYHCVIIKLPNEFEPTLDMFFKSQFSQMYNESMLERLMIKTKDEQGKIGHVYGVLTKHPDYRSTFQDALNSYFNTSVVIDDDRELDLPVKLEDEILDYHKKHLL